MNALPVIERELRSEARHALNYWLRLASAGVMLAMVALCYLNLDGQIAGRGNRFFGVLQPTLFSLIWLLGPIMTCDSISKERREGTLGLLFLTPLRPVDVGIAKALSGALRAFTLILAALPMVTLPLLMGGVSGQDVLRAAMMDIMALTGAIAAGLLASSRCREFSRAALLSLLFAGLALLILGNLQITFFLQQMFAGNLGPVPNEPMPAWVLLGFLTIGPWIVCSGVGDIWQQPQLATNPTMLWICFGQMIAAFLLLLGTLTLLNRNLRHLSVETGLTKRQLWWWRIFCTPRIFTGFLASSHRGMLNRNPIGWLQRRTWTARAATWGWLGALLVVETALVTSSLGGWNFLMDAQPMIGLLLALGITFSAADSFRKERETGALELLLVTPLSAKQVIRGRLFGLWGQYLPAFLCFLATWFYTSSMRLWGNPHELAAERFAFALIYLTTFICVPLIGLDQSLHRRNFFAAWLSTVTMGLVVPILGPVTLIHAWHWFLDAFAGGASGISDQTILNSLYFAALLQCIFATRATARVHRNLSERRFALGK